MKAPAKNILLKNSQNVILRSATADDAELMLQHLRLTHTDAYRNMNQSAQYWISFPASAEAKILADFETAENKLMLVAEFENKIVAGLGLVGQGAEFVKHNATLGLSVQSAFRNTGLGTQMMIYAMELAKRAGFHRIELSVRTYNDGAIFLYEKLGFQKIGRLKDVALIDGQYVDEFSYQKIL